VSKGKKRFLLPSGHQSRYALSCHVVLSRAGDKLANVEKNNCGIRNMNFFAKALGDYLNETPISQSEFCRKTGIPKPQLSRILSGRTSCTRDALDVILGGVPEAIRPQLVIAYFRDYASPLALGYLHGGEQENDWAKFEGRGLSRHGKDALATLLNSSHVGIFEKFCLNLIEALNLKVKPSHRTSDAAAHRPANSPEAGDAGSTHRKGVSVLSALARSAGKQRVS
jgi:hypothetical protein